MAANNTLHLPGQRQAPGPGDTPGFSRTHQPCVQTLMRYLLSTYHVQTLYYSFGSQVGKTWPDGKAALQTK